MRWRSMIMATSNSSNFGGILSANIAGRIAAGKVAGYTLFARKREAGDYILLIPPGAVVFLERMPTWRRRLRACSGTPDLKGFEPIPVC